MLVLLLALTAMASSQSVDLSQEGSCPFSEDVNYFDHIEVDDEDYQGEEEGSAAQLEESLIRGPPVFTDSEEEDITTQISTNIFLQNEIENQKHNVETHQFISKIVPENLVIKNQTHGQLNGRLTITNSLDNEEFIFKEEDEELEEEEERDVKEIVIESSSYK